MNEMEKMLNKIFNGLNEDNVFDLIDDFFEMVTVNKDIEDFSQKEFLKDNKDFLYKLKVLIPNLEYTFYHNVLYLYEGDLKHGFGMITYSPEKKKYSYYILSINKKQKVFSIKKGIKNVDVFRFVKMYIEIVKNYSAYRNLNRIFKKENKFNTKLFIKNMEEDLGIKINELVFYTRGNIKFLIDFEGNITLSEINKYIKEYIEELERLGIEFREIHYKVKE